MITFYYEALIWTFHIYIIQMGNQKLHYEAHSIWFNADRYQDKFHF